MLTLALEVLDGQLQTRWVCSGAADIEDLKAREHTRNGSEAAFILKVPNTRALAPQEQILTVSAAAPPGLSH